MTSDTLIAGLLSAPIGPDWTVDRLAEEILVAIAAEPSLEGQELVIDQAALTERQSQRILRPLLACLATKSVAEPVTSPNLYGGRLWFKRMGPDGPVWILGQFDNRPGLVRASLRRSIIDPEKSKADHASATIFAVPIVRSATGSLTSNDPSARTLSD